MDGKEGGQLNFQVDIVRLFVISPAFFSELSAVSDLVWKISSFCTS